MMQPLPEKITVLNLSFLAISTCGFTKKAVINNATTIIPRFVFHPLKLKKIIRLFSLKLFIKKLCLQFLPHFCTLSPLRRARGLRTTFLGLSFSTAQPLGPTHFFSLFKSVSQRQEFGASQLGQY